MTEEEEDRRYKIIVILAISIVFTVHAAAFTLLFLLLKTIDTVTVTP